MMNSLLRILSIIFLLTFLISCDSDNQGKKETPNQSLNLTIEYRTQNYSYELDRQIYAYEMKAIEDAKGLVYVIHNKENDSLIVAKRLEEEQIKDLLDEKENLKIQQPLPAGNYYVSILAWEKDFSFSDRAYKMIQLPYKEAVCEIDPRGQAFVGKAEVTVNENENVESKILLEKKMNFFAFFFNDANRMPAEAADIHLEINVKNVPRAFYLQSGVTLNKQQELAYNIPRYADNKFMDSRPMHKGITHLYMLDNDNLQDTGLERGTISLVCLIEQIIEPRVTSKIVNERLPQVSNKRYYKMESEIYSTEPVEVSVE